MNARISFQIWAKALNKFLQYLTFVLLVALAYAPPTSAQTCTPAPAGLVAWWSADGNALDSRSRSNGALINGTTFAAGQNGQAFSFDGMNDSIDTHLAPNPNLNFALNNFTIEAWVKLTSPGPGTSRMIYANGYNLDSIVTLRIETDNRARFLIRDRFGVALDVFGTTTTLNDGAWHHVAGVRKGTTARLYVDGTQEGGDVSNPSFEEINLFCNFAFIGGFNSTAVCATPAIENFFSGLIDEVSVYNRALSATEIAAIHAAGTAGKCKPTAAVAPSGQVGWWAGDGSPNDISGNGNNGTLGGATSGFAVGRAGQSFSLGGSADDSVNIPDSPSLDLISAGTVEMWLFLNDGNITPGIVRSILGKGNWVTNQASYTLVVHDNPQIIRFDLFKGDGSNFVSTVSTSVAPLVGSWNHIAASWDAANIKLYINGILTSTQSYSFVRVDTPQQLTLGGGAGTTGLAAIRGRLDEASLYNRALTPAEITSIFNAGLAGKLKAATTATGSNVSTNVGSDATITFPTVSAAGTTQQIPLDAALFALPAGFTHTGLAYDVATAASVSGNISLSFHLPSFTTQSQFSFLKVLHQEGGVFVDRTVAQNFASRTLTAQVSSLSPFVIANGTAPTAVTLESFTATGFDDGQVLLQWQTGFEVDNLGFNVYREQDGKRVKLTPQLVAGSALLADSRVSLLSGHSYQWADVPPASGEKTSYWLEDIDLKGKGKWNGPIQIEFSPIKTRSDSYRHAALLSSLGMHASMLSEGNGSSQVENRASLGQVSADALELQSGLAAQPAVKLSVNREGWYRVNLPELVAAGLDSKADPRLLQMFVDGRELPISVTTGKEGQLDSSAAIEFYGTGVDSASTDTRVYWLVVGSRPGLRVPRVKGNGPPAAARSFPSTVERKDRTIYFSGLRNGEAENFFGAVIAATPVDQLLFLRRLDQGSPAKGTLEVAVQGVTQLPHSVKVILNGIDLGALEFNGQELGVTRFSIAQSHLREGFNQVTLAAQMGASDISLVDYLRLTYQHNYTADNDSLKLTAPGLQQITIDGFASDQVRVVDVTDANIPKEIIGAIEKRKAGYAISFAAPEAGERSLIAFTTSQRPTSVSPDQPSNLRSLSADFVIISRREFVSSLNPLVALRQSQGLSVTLVDIEDIYDEFSFGQKTPFAVKGFLALANSSWKKKPRFVLFAGDASYDPKDYLGFGDLDRVSTRLIDTEFMETSSDEWFSDFDGDGIGELATGRLPARTSEELSTIVAKITRYEQSSPAEEALLVADGNDGFNFEQANTDLLSLIPPGLRITQVNRGRLDPEMARRSLFEALFRKQFLVNYAGHGSVDQWRGNLLTNSDAAQLTNEHLPLFVMMTCLNGYFHDPALDSLAESLMKAERGGAVAVWASSGMTLPMDQALMNQELYRQLFNQPRAITLGEAMMRAKTSITDSDVRRTWLLLGDPTTRLR